jgi:hypothetical protein
LDVLVVPLNVLAVPTLGVSLTPKSAESWFFCAAALKQIQKMQITRPNILLALRIMSTPQKLPF